MTNEQAKAHLNNMLYCVNKVTGTIAELNAIQTSYLEIEKFVNEKTIIDTPSPTDGLQDQSGIETKKD